MKQQAESWKLLSDARRSYRASRVAARRILAHRGPRRRELITGAVLMGASVALVLVMGDFGPLWNTLAMLLVPVALLGVPVALFGLAIWAVLPLDRAARKIEAPIQFMLVDFLCLFFLVQMPMALIHSVLSDTEAVLRWTLDIYAWFGFGVMWLASAQRLSRAGIHRPGLRALFLCFVLPTAIFAMVLGPVLSVFLGKAAVQRDGRSFVLALLGDLVLLVAVLVARRVVRRLVATAVRERG
jgi:hypothetical protein